jgi:hypothetical protein
MLTAKEFALLAEFCMDATSSNTVNERLLFSRQLAEGISPKQFVMICAVDFQGGTSQGISRR